MNVTIRKSNAWREALYGYTFIAPMMLGYIIFLLGPILMAFMMSFTNWSLFESASYVGLANYRQAIMGEELFWSTVKNTLYFSAGLVPLNIMISLSLALLLQKKVKGIGLFRTIVFTPVVTSLVAWGIVWKYIFNTDGGLVNQLLHLFGMTGPAWLYDFQLAMPVVILVSVLKNVGMNMVIFLAALQDVPVMYYEAAKIDGASPWKRFVHVTLPLIAPSLFLTMVITTIGSLKVFGQIYVMTGGGPGDSTKVLVYYIYEQAFKLYQFGYASAVAFLLFGIILLLTVLQWVVRKRWIYHEQ
ncbi:carbohydrate ABC transporter permease [Paenibacillus roseipurpureus]|uniref:Sugar ABC transporter permease n=1 Tax=Paenibacillus roseopurpureus TaxID=2918901 RepID=A0AA96LJ87_9BACL|nr:sugar ABC transporter permease [Paenibacillus sp. MBLB1832]WNR42872.1 sugar ABC transporter permease [Paenibacillus sp. MBLB1832]